MRHRCASWVAVVLLGLALMSTSRAEAARQFNGTSDYLISASTIDLTAYTKITVAYWMYWDTFANDDKHAMTHGAIGAGGADNAWAIVPDNSSTSNYRVIGNGATSYTSSEFTRPSGATWHHYVILYDRTAASNEISTIYVDGVSQSLSHATNANNADTFGNKNIAVMSKNGASNFGAGRFAELAIWGGYLFTQTDVDALYQSGVGALATTVQSGSLVRYWRILGDASPETPTIGAINLTVNGTTKVAHPFGEPVSPSTRAPKEWGQRRRAPR